MKKVIILLALFTIIWGQPAHGQIHQVHLKKYAEKEANEWNLKLNLSNYKTQKLAKVLLEYKIKEGEAVLDGVINFEETQEFNMNAKQDELKMLFSSQEYKVYQLLNEYSTIDRVEYLNSIVEAYAKDKGLVTAIVKYRERNILPILRVHRGELEKKISEVDKAALSSLRIELYETLDKCIIDCKTKHASHSHQHKSLEEVLFKEITSQISDKMSPMNQLLTITLKYEEEIHEEKSHFENNTSKWNTDMEAIHKEFILDNHIETFRKTLESNSIVAWKHIRFDAFFLLLDPSTEEEAKKILKLGMIMLPQLEI